MQRAHEVGGGVRAADHRLGDDLDERHARAVEIDRRHQPGMDRLAGVFLEVDAGERDLAELRRAGGARDDVDRTALAQRLVVLRDLIALGLVRIEVVLAREPRHRADPRPDGEAEPQRGSSARALNTGSAPGRPSTVGSTSEFGGAPNSTADGENALLAVASWTWTSRPMTGSHEVMVASKKPNLFLVPCSVCNAQPSARPPGLRSPSPTRASSAAAAWITVASSSGLPSSCAPIGSPSLVSPHGTLAPGSPARLHASV